MCVEILTNGLDSPGVGEVVRHNLAHLREVPAVPLPAPHVVVIQLLVKVIQKGCGRESRGGEVRGRVIRASRVQGKREEEEKEKCNISIFTPQS